jgi:hypothetical protein
MKEICMHFRKKLYILINVKIIIVYMWKLEQLKENYKITAFNKILNWEIKEQSIPVTFH